MEAENPNEFGKKIREENDERLTQGLDDPISKLRPLFR